MSPRRLILGVWLGVVLCAVPFLATSTAGAAIAPPWCGTPIPDGTAALPDGSSPTHPAGSYPHIPWYAIGCTLERIQSESNGRMTYRVTGQSALGFDLYAVTFNALDTKQQRKDFATWQKIREDALDRPDKAQKRLAKSGGDVKIPLMIQAGIHGNESEGVDATLMLIERLATTPYGEDPFVDDVLNHAILIINVIHNPDGHILNQRANGNNFDLNRDWLTQSQPETRATFPLIQQWLPADLLDQHGYVTPTLVEATTKPHNPGIEYDLWLKWNQGRIDANEAAMNAIGYAITRPVNDWCADGDFYDPVTKLCPDGTNHWGPKWAESWDDWGPFYTPMYSQLVGLNGSTVEMCNNASTAPTNPCRVPGTTLDPPRGRLGARTAQYTVATSTLTYDIANRVELMNDQLEVYRRGVTDAARPPLSSLPNDPTDPSKQFRNEETYWMHEYPQAYVIPIGDGQRSDVEARRLVRWLLENGIRVDRVTKDYGSLAEGSYVVFMNQALRGLADTALGPGVDVSDRIGVLYAPPGAWSHGELWGADVETIADGVTFDPKTKRVESVATVPGAVTGAAGASWFALDLDSPTAVRTLNGLLADGASARLASAPFTDASGHEHPAGSVLFPASAQAAIAAAAAETGLNFAGVSGAGPASEPIDRSPRIAVLTGALTQEIWVLRNLGFTADPVSTATINSSPTDPLANYDAIFNTSTIYPGNTPGNATVRSRLANFFANGGGYIGSMVNGSNFLVSGGQVTGLTPATLTSNATRSIRGWSGIITWANSASGTGQITGAYGAQDRAIVDPPVWFTSVPAGWAVDGSLPLGDFFLSGLWKTNDPQSLSAPGAAMIAHGTNTAGTARITSFAMNPLYRADPEREWPMLASAAYWVDQ